MRVVYVCIGVAFLLGPAALSAADSINDARVTTRIETTLQLNDHLNVHDIRASSVGGRVTLTGTVPDNIQRELADDVVASVEGVDTIDNRITVEPGAAFSEGGGGERTFRQRVEDRSVSASVRTRLVYHRQFRGLKLGVRTVDNVVTLTGVVPDKRSESLITQIAAETRGVESVINGLSVAPKREFNEARDVGQIISDEWVEKRVETTILLHRDHSIRHIDVEVNDGICILTGSVYSEERKARVGAIAADVNGVLKLINDVLVGGHPVQTLPAMEDVNGAVGVPDTGNLLEPVDLPDAPKVVIEPLDF